MRVEEFEVAYNGEKFPTVRLVIPTADVPESILMACYQVALARKLQESIAGFFPDKKGNVRLTPEKALEHFVKLIMGEATRSRGEFPTNVIEIARKKLGKAYREIKPLAAGTSMEKALHAKCKEVEEVLADI